MQLVIFIPKYDNLVQRKKHADHLEDIDRIYPLFSKDDLIIANNDVTLGKFLFDGYNATFPGISIPYPASTDIPTSYLEKEIRKHNQTKFVVLKNYDYRYHTTKINEMKDKFNISLINETGNIEIYDVKTKD